MAKRDWPYHTKLFMNWQTHNEPVECACSDRKKKKRYPCQDRSRLQNFNPPDWRMDPSTVAVLSRNASLSRHKSQNSRSPSSVQETSTGEVFFFSEVLKTCLYKFSKNTKEKKNTVRLSNTSHWKSLEQSVCLTKQSIVPSAAYRSQLNTTRLIIHKSHQRCLFLPRRCLFLPAAAFFYHVQRLRAQQGTATTRTARLAAIFEILDGAIVASEVAVPDSVQ